MTNSKEVLVWVKYWDTDLKEFWWKIKGHYTLVAETEKAWLVKGWIFKKWLIKSWHRIEPIYEPYEE